MRAAIEKIVKALASEPDNIDVTERVDGKTVRIDVRAGENDMGRLIGREGRTIKAMRSILFYAGQKQGKRFYLDLVE